MGASATHKRSIRHQHLPSAGPAREQLRVKGQFWTPDWVAEAMVAYVLQGHTDHIFDPAVGAGAFFRAAKTLGKFLDKSIKLLGTEVDPTALLEAGRSDLDSTDLAAVETRDFVLHPPTRRFAAIVANPPYIRHHRLSPEVKTALQTYGQTLTGKALDGRAGLHVYFLLRALERLQQGGRLAFIMPADTCEGKFAPSLWTWITKHYYLEAVVTFAPDATPFPSVDTNAMVFMIRKATPRLSFHWVRCTAAHTDDLKEWILSGFNEAPHNSLDIYERYLDEALRSGLSRLPSNQIEAPTTLADYAYIMRGIATGANDFFFFTKQQAQDLGIPDEFLRLAIGRTRDVVKDEITTELIEQLDARGRPTRLLALDSTPASSLPSPVQTHLSRGEKADLPQRPLISQRKPWYKMESRNAPPFLFAYLGRRNVRFIRNTARVVPLTCFLCVYPRKTDAVSLEQLWIVLNHPDTIANLSRVGKSYGQGAIKVEPRALETLPIPATAINAARMEVPQKITQPTLL